MSFAFAPAESSFGARLTLFYDAKAETKYSAGICEPQWVTKDAKAMLPAPALINADKIISNWKNASNDSNYNFDSTVTAPLKLYAA